ncbi:DUF2269 family protein [Kangiella shandongensis]|uniref:DUF2269 family protein n=1 Tax=Kangiella shandongensis TaxID=2763258 RepID=UPI001CBF9F62|nr:DUF2269 domain-containing protein [Kangiella shandongensis]
MNSYLTLKLLHILSAVVVAGTGTGLAFFMFMANRSDSHEAIKVTAKNVILGDWIFTLPGVITLIITGPLLMLKLGYSFHSPWFYWVSGLFIFIGACWIPVLRIQYKLYGLSKSIEHDSDALLQFKKLMKYWTLLGAAAFSAILVIFWLMIFKPISVV